MKRTITIIAPHVDDEIYSTMSVISSAISEGHKLNLVYCSYSPKQEERLKIVREYFNKRYFRNVVFLYNFPGSFPDGDSSKCNVKDLVAPLDGLIEESDEVYYCAPSHHQDHKFVNDAVRASLRSRTSLSRLKLACEYGYPYNFQSVNSNLWRELTPNALEDKIEILKKLDEIDNILSENSVNSEKFIRSVHSIYGCQSLLPYAEVFEIKYQLYG